MQVVRSGVTIECVQGDITDQPDVDAIVCAANAHLTTGAGVAGAVHRKAGPGLYAECEPLAPITTGTVVITSGHGLPNPYCLHALGPVYERSERPAVELAACYQGILALAERNGLRSIATPAISTGIFGYPVAEAADVALRTVAAAAPDLRTVRLIRFVLWDASDLAAHARILEDV